MSPLLAVVAVAAAVCVFTLVASLLTREYSWVDRLWSVVPVGYVWTFSRGSPHSPIRA